MAVDIETLRSRLEAAFPEALIVVEDLAGDGDHYKAHIVSEQFIGLNRVRQHQMVNAALSDLLAGPLQALMLQTEAPQ